MNITAKNIKMKIGDNEILKGVSIDSKNREFVGIIGPNGSGKSTLLKLMNGLLSKDSGIILINGLKPSKETKKIVSGSGQLNKY